MLAACVLAKEQKPDDLTGVRATLDVISLVLEDNPSSEKVLLKCFFFFHRQFFKDLW